ncbi:hypothetical protein SUGI_0700830 [Cryptomeria japonica]|nr:hypothetical protein SUGI_0700830 [Cryptomeria japonica]
MNTKAIILLFLLSFTLGLSSFSDARVLKSTSMANPSWGLPSIAKPSVVPANPHSHVLMEVAPVSVVEKKNANAFSSKAEDFITSSMKDSVVSYPMAHSPGVGHGSPP